MSVCVRGTTRDVGVGMRSRGAGMCVRAGTRATLGNAACAMPMKAARCHGSAVCGLDVECGRHGSYTDALLRVCARQQPLGVDVAASFLVDCSSKAALPTSRGTEGLGKRRSLRCAGRRGGKGHFVSALGTRDGLGRCWRRLARRRGHRVACRACRTRHARRRTSRVGLGTRGDRGRGGAVRHRRRSACGGRGPVVPWGRVVCNAIDGDAAPKCFWTRLRRGR